MALDKVILDHVEKIEEIENDLSDDIDSLIDKINIDALMDDPNGVLESVGAAVLAILEDSYYPELSDLGFEFAEQVKNDTIEVTPNKDPKLNEGLVDRGENRG